MIQVILYEATDRGGGGGGGGFWKTPLGPDREFELRPTH